MRSLDDKNNFYIIPRNRRLQRYPPFFVDVDHETPPFNLDALERIEKLGCSVNNTSRTWPAYELRSLEREILRENHRVHTNNGKLPTTLTETQLLHDVSNINWESISFSLMNRTPEECKIKWTVKQHPFINEEPFDDTELNFLKDCIIRNGGRNWLNIAKEHGVI